MKPSLLHMAVEKALKRLPLVAGVALAGLASAVSTSASANDSLNSNDLGPIVIPSQFKTPAAVGGRDEVTPTILSAGEPWWRIFQDGTLDRLEHDAITANPDLRQAMERVVEARAQARAIESGFFPSVTAPLQATRQRTTNTGPVTQSRIVGSNFLSVIPGADGSGFPNTFAGQALSNTFDDFQAPLVVGYEIDVFGRVRHAYGQARASGQASAADRQAVELSLTTQVAANYFALRTLDSAIATLQTAIRTRAAGVHIQKERVSGGAGSDIDLLRAEVESANTEADLPDAIQKRAELENALAVLCGQSASAFHLEPRPLEQSPPPLVPEAIPAQVLARRPDLVEASLRIAAAGEGVKASRAQRLPSFNLKAGYGYESARATEFFEDQSHTWAIAGAINIPIFDGGRADAELRAAKARNDEAVDAYRQTALTAFREVENALSNLHQRTLQADSRRRAAEGARKVFEATQQSYREGAITYFEVIDAQRVLLAAELSQAETLNARYAATIDLVRATGGGYGSATESSP